MLTRRHLLKLTLSSLAQHLVGGSIPARAGAPARVSLGAARACPTFVLDGALIDFDHPWTANPGLRQCVVAASPPALAYPGHHLADYWNEQAGWIDAAPFQSRMNTDLPPDILALLPVTDCAYDLAELQALRESLPVDLHFTANLLTRSPRVNSGGTPDALADASEGKAALLSALDACDRRGIPLRWLALGDRLAGDLPWEGSLPARVFHALSEGLTEYPLVAADWASAVHAAFPDVAIAVQAAGSPLAPGLVSQQWNRRLVDRFAGHPAVSALSFSLAFPGDLGLSGGAGSGSGSGRGSAAEQKAQYARLKDPAAVEALLSLPATMLRAWLDQPGGAGSLGQAGFRLWASAFHLDDPFGALRYTWAHGLLLAGAIQALLVEPAVDLVVLHNIADAFHSAFFTSLSLFAPFLKLDASDGVDPLLLAQSVTVGQPTALGIACQLFIDATRGCAEAAPLAFDPSAGPLVWGWSFSTGSAGVRRLPSRRLLVANQTAAPVSLDLSGLLAEGYQPPTGLCYSAAPHAFITNVSGQPGAPFALLSATAAASEDGVLALPPYALARLDAAPVNHPLYLPIASR